MLRNNVVRNILQQAIERMEKLSDKLELWIVVSMLPDSSSLEPLVSTRDSKTIAIELGPLLRNTWTMLNSDHMVVITAADTVGKIPYDSIYCIATTGHLAQMLEWTRHTDNEEDTAYVNLVTPEHDMPEHLLLPQR